MKVDAGLTAGEPIANHVRVAEEPNGGPHVDGPVALIPHADGTAVGTLSAPERDRTVAPDPGNGLQHSLLRMRTGADVPTTAVERGPGRQTVSVIIPALNEEQNIAWVLKRMPSMVDEVILVDGHSSDRTVEVARAVRPDIVVVTQRGHGKGEAARVAFAASTGDLIVMIDADGSMEPREIPRYVAPLMHDYDFVKGSRFLAGGGSTDLTTVRRIGARLLVRATNSMFLVRFTDLCYGFCSFRRECLPALALTAHGFEIETELAVHALKAHLRIAEVPSMELPRRCGTSNLRAFRDGQQVLRTLIRERMVRQPRPVVDPIDVRVLHSWQSRDADLPTPAALAEGTWS